MQSRFDLLPLIGTLLLFGSTLEAQAPVDWLDLGTSIQPPNTSELAITDSGFLGIGARRPSFPFQVQGTLRNGSGTISSAGTTVIGSGSSFGTQFRAGAELLVAGEPRTVISIESTSQLTIDQPFPGDLDDAAYEVSEPIFTIDALGNAAIGANKPTSSRLVLKGSDYRLLEFDRTARPEVSNKFFIGTSWGTDGVDHLGFHTTGPAGNNFVVFRSNGKVGIGSPAPQSRLTVSSNNLNGNSSWAATIDSATSDATTAVLNLRNAAAQSLFFARSDGKIGIGTASPGALLDVAGPVKVQGTAAVSGDLFGGRLLTPSALEFRSSAGAEIGELRAESPDLAIEPADSGQLKIRSPLHVFGEDGRYLTLGGLPSPPILFTKGDTVNDLDLHVGVADGGVFKVFGRVEVTGGLILHPLQNGAASGSVCFVDTGNGDHLVKCSSSERYKTNVAPLAPGLEALGRLRPVAYDWKENGQADIGFIAEEVAEIDPRLVFRSAGRIEGVKYDRMSAVLVNAIQEQQRQIEALKAIVCLDHPDSALCASPAKP